MTNKIKYFQLLKEDALKLINKKDKYSIYQALILLNEMCKTIRIFRKTSKTIC